MESTLLYKLSNGKSLEHFKRVVLVSSPYDQYVPSYSARIQVTLILILLILILILILINIIGVLYFHYYYYYYYHCRRFLKEQRPISRTARLS